MRKSNQLYRYAEPYFFKLWALEKPNRFVRHNTDYKTENGVEGVQYRYLSFLNEKMEVLYEIEKEELAMSTPFVMGNKIIFVDAVQEVEDEYSFTSYELIEK
ncbi:hypothetical protein ACV07N_13500 [Roseivirga echinicomitans]